MGRGRETRASAREIRGKSEIEKHGGERKTGERERESERDQRVTQ